MKPVDVPQVVWICVWIVCIIFGMFLGRAWVQYTLQPKPEKLWLTIEAEFEPETSPVYYMDCDELKDYLDNNLGVTVKHIQVQDASEVVWQ